MSNPLTSGARLNPNFFILAVGPILVLSNLTRSLSTGLGIKEKHISACPPKHKRNEESCHDGIARDRPDDDSQTALRVVNIRVVVPVAR